MNQFGTIYLMTLVVSTLIGLVMSTPVTMSNVASRSAEISLEKTIRNLDLLFKHIISELNLLKATGAVTNRDMTSGNQVLSLGFVVNSQKRLRNLFRSADIQIRRLQKITNHNLNSKQRKRLQPESRIAQPNDELVDISPTDRQ